MNNTLNGQSKIGDVINWVLDQGLWTRRGFLFLMGAAYSLAFAPTNVFPVIFLVFPLLISFADRAEDRKTSFSFGWWFGLGLFVAGLSWVGNSFAQQDQVPVFLAPIAVLMLAAGMALYYGLVLVIYGHLKRKGWFRVVIFAAVWILIEALRSFLFTGLPWHIIGTMWANWLPMAQSVYYLSLFGTGFLTILIAFIPLFLLDGSPQRPAVIYVTSTILIALMMIVTGSMRLYDNETRLHLGTNVRLVQANVPQTQKWVPYLIDDHFDKHLSLSRTGAVDGKLKNINLLIWPETAVQRQSFDREGSMERWRISRLLSFGAYAITGVPRVSHTDDKASFYNSLMAVNSRGDLYARYDKSHLVPFGEYVPFQGVLNKLGLSSLTGGSFSGGSGPVTITLPGVPAFSPLICYEIIFPGAGINHNSKRPEWLLNVTNDAWFGRSKGPYQHLALARMRAIEEGLPLVRAASTGVSAVIDPYGRTVKQLAVGVEGIVDSALPYPHKTPPISSSLKILIVLSILALLCLYTPIALILSGRVSNR